MKLTIEYLVSKQKNFIISVITENGNIILDAWFDNIDETLERRLKNITGVVETGLFIGYNVEIVAQ